MADKTGIQWTQPPGYIGATWNPIRGCDLVSPGCTNCYAMWAAHRMDHPGGAYEGLTRMGPKGPLWNGEVRRVHHLLDQPLRWSKPRCIFVNSMSDLFHPKVPFEFIAAVFAVMACCPRHIFQILTKRPERAHEFMRWAQGLPTASGEPHRDGAPVAGYLGEFLQRETRGRVNPWQRAQKGLFFPPDVWPLTNVWLGVSAEDQIRLDKRSAYMAKMPSVVRWWSLEPQLGPIDLRLPLVRPDWVVIGGESGALARETQEDWLRSSLEQCKAHGVPVYVKQMGAKLSRTVPAPGGRGDFDVLVQLRHKKGGDPEEWSEDLQVREWPTYFDAAA